MPGRDSEHRGQEAVPSDPGAPGPRLGGLDGPDGPDGLDGLGEPGGLDDDCVLVELTAARLLTALHADAEPPAVLIQLAPPAGARS